MLGRLSAMMQTHNSSVTPSEDIFEPVLTSVIDPIFELCAAMTVNRNASESSVLHLNVLTRVQNTLWPFAFASKRNDGLLKLRDEYLQTLIKHQSDSILQRVGLADIQQLSHQFNESEHKDVPLSEMPGMNASSIRNIVKEFYKTLFSLGTIDLPECERLVLPQLRMAARDGVAQALNQSYQSLYCAIKDPKSGYADPDVILEYSPSDVSTLLDTSVNT
uniref:Conserved Oligomeric Golgi complex subunit 6 C-terminal domain-containing protein n=1 Tax=Spongospora subterranea TaxID=70186 RepID=A0A0H5QFZ2_9EUKA|eukprot:CRZ00973.1 hypothetical protein [Spongospora subterranea]